MNKIEENNKKELEKPLEENLDSEEETYKEKALKFIKEKQIKIKVINLLAFIIGYLGATIIFKFCFGS